MIGMARVHNGLYILDGKGGGFIRKQHSLAYFSSRSASNLPAIWLHHFRLGHPSFIMLKQMFSSLFNSLDPSNFQCDECIIAKYHRVSYSISNKLASMPFHLVHSDVWGPSKIANYSGVK